MAFDVDGALAPTGRVQARGSGSAVPGGGVQGQPDGGDRGAHDHGRAPVPIDCGGLSAAQPGGTRGGARRIGGTEAAGAGRTGAVEAAGRMLRASYRARTARKDSTTARHSPMAVPAFGSVLVRGGVMVGSPCCRRRRGPGMAWPSRAVGGRGPGPVGLAPGGAGGAPPGAGAEASGGAFDRLVQHPGQAEGVVTFGQSSAPPPEERRRRCGGAELAWCRWISR